MRNKGAIVALTLIVTALCLYYLSFTLVSRGIQKDATNYAIDSTGIVDFSKKQKYLDSIWTEPAYNLLGISYTFQEVKENELNLGLDLQGGMHVILEISPVDIIKGLSGNNEDPNFTQAINEARIAQRSSQSRFVNLFYSAYKKLEPNKPLAQIFATAANRGRINFDTPDDDILTILDEEVESAIDRSFNILRTRIDRFGTSQPNIQRLQNTGRIQIEIPGADNPERVRKLLQGVAKLEFWEVATPDEFQNSLLAINNMLVQEQEKLRLIERDLKGNIEEPPQEDLGNLLSTENQDDSLADDSAEDLASQLEGDTTATGLDSLTSNQSPIFTLLQTGDGTLVYNVKDTSKINAIFKRDEVQSLMPRTLRIFWDVKPHDHEGDTGEPHLELHFVKSARSGQAPLTGEVITDARQDLDEASRPSISMQMNATGAKAWKKLTGDNVGRRIAIVLDSYVYSAPTVQNEIPNGNSQITGNFSLDEAKDLANILKAGSLPAPTRIVQEVIIGPTLGKEAQRQGIISIVSGLVLVIVFMVAYYARGGFVANFALIFNIFFIMGILAQLNAALTLPGIAGIVLTIGMSIDANVLIFERIREELRNGRPLREAIDNGFRKAYSSIIDSNVTTFLTAVILNWLGQGPVKGFAITLMIGIACSFFSAVFITRVIIDWMVARKGDKTKLSFRTPLSGSLLQDLSIDFLGKRKIAFIVSALLISGGVALISINGLNLGVDFKGGRSYVVTFSEPVAASEMKSELTRAFEGNGTEVKTFGGSNIIKVTTSYLVDDESDSSDVKVERALINGLTNITGKEYERDDSKVNNSTFAISSSEKVGASIADDIKNASMESVALSLVVIFLYIVIRFRRWQFGLGAIIALFHDTLAVLSCYAIAEALGFSFEIDQVFIAAILTVIGYSINDTVIVFDRIRETLGLKTSSDIEKTVNTAINNTLSRTMITSLTTLLVITVLLLFGGEVLRGFSFSLFVGIIIGTYSSIFIASPIVVDLQKRKLSKAPATS